MAQAWGRNCGRGFLGRQSSHPFPTSRANQDQTAENPASPSPPRPPSPVSPLRDPPGLLCPAELSGPLNGEGGAVLLGPPELLQWGGGRERISVCAGVGEARQLGSPQQVCWLRNTWIPHSGSDSCRGVEGRWRRWGGLFPAICLI